MRCNLCRPGALRFASGCNGVGKFYALVTSLADTLENAFELNALVDGTPVAKVRGGYHLAEQAAFSGE
jgi:hypothetical protein